MVLFFCLTTLQNWQNCPAALTNHSGFLSIQLGFFRTSRGGANTKAARGHVKKHKHRLAVHFKKHAAIPQTSCTHESELQLSFYAVWFIRDLAPPGTVFVTHVFTRTQGARSGHHACSSAFLRFPVGCRSPPVLVWFTTHPTPKRRTYYV